MASILASLVYIRHIQAAPVQNTTASRTEVAPLWVDDPSGRGTWNLLWSCTFTLSICVWTSIHLNLPSQGEGSWIRWIRKVKWLFVAILAPEVVVFIAFQQFMISYLFLKKLKDAALTQNSKVGDKGVDCGFDMTYAHFVAMGGFALRMEHLHNVLKRVTITPTGMLFLASQGNFVRPDIDTINDKSKASLLAKGLAALQVLWLAGQVIERKVAGLPITLLEVHTLVHVFCALVMYLLWLSKPLNVTEPTIVPAEDFQEEVAYMLFVTARKLDDGFAAMGGDASDKKAKFSWYGNLKSSPIVETIEADEESCLDPLPINTGNPEIITHFKKQSRDSNGETHDYTITTIEESYVPRRESEIACTMVSGQALLSGLGPEYRRPGLKLALSRKDVKRLDLAGSFVAKEAANSLSGNSIIPVAEAITYVFEKRLPKPPVKVFPDRGERPHLLCDRASNLSWDQIDTFFDDILDAVTYTLFFLIFAVVDGAYAGAHLGALSVMFPSPTERLMWKIACYILLGVTAFTTLVTCPVTLLVRHVERPHGFTFHRHYLFTFLLRLVSSFIVYGIPVIFLWARTYIVIESFISLRHVPVGVYQTPQGNIMGYVPHL